MADRNTNHAKDRETRNGARDGARDAPATDLPGARTPPVHSDPDVTMGGQAVIEGVMMRGPRSYAVAVRRPQGDIVMISHPFVPVVRRKRWLGLPVVRGAASLVEMILLGYRALDYSANVAEQAAREAEVPEGSAAPGSAASSAERAIGRGTMTAVFLASMAIAMVLFVALPNVATHLLGKVLFRTPAATAAATEGPAGAAQARRVQQTLPRAADPPARSGLIEEQRPVTYNLIAGVVRVFVIVAYIWLIALLKDVRRLFQYHGAEHKVVMAYEKGIPLDVEHVRSITTLHPRCGTTFIAVVVFVSIIVFAVLAALILHLYPAFAGWSIWARKSLLIVLHVAFMPLVAGIAYEITRRAGRRPGFPLYRLLLLPGLAFQRITTRRPDDAMIEVALAAFREALEPARLA